MKIAFLGLGRMGAGMAGCLARDEAHELTVWNRTPDKAQALQALGATVARQAVAAVAGADLIFTSLLDDRSVEAIFHAGSAALAALRPGATHLCVTTISPACADRLQALHAAHGTRYVSGPVIGRPDTASAGRLAQFLAGDASAAAEAVPVCRAFASQVVVLPGLAGVANSQKLCINFFIAALIEAMGECLTLGDKLGASRQILARVFQQSLAAPELKAYAERMLQRDTGSAAGFSMVAGRKDLALMREAAAIARCPLDIAEIIAGKIDVALAQGMEALDWSATQEITRQRAGLASEASDSEGTAC
jgi:3-hydroxyisobutyrate dehydrogenase-like beta-hydroxyacid dehydrogenase